MLPPCPPEWRIADAVPVADGIGGKVWRVRLAGGGLAALKQASAAARVEVAQGKDFLRWIDGDGAIRLLGEDGDLSLLEWAGERRLLDHLREHGDAEASEIAAEVVARLHRPRTAAMPASLLTLEDNFASLFRHAETDRLAGRRSHYVETAEVAGRLLSNQQGVRPLHGDIHHENILSGDRGWLAIDPKGILGDPAYDTANMFQNPVHSPLRQDPARIMTTARILAPAIGRDIETVLAFAYAYSGLSAAWWQEDGHAEATDSTIAIGRAIGEALAQVRS